MAIERPRIDRVGRREAKMVKPAWLTVNDMTKEVRA